MAKQIQFMKKDELLALAAEKKVDVPKCFTTAGQIKAYLKVCLEKSLTTESVAREPNPYNEKLKTEPRLWVRVFNRDLAEGIDFGFTFEGHRYHLMNGEVVQLPQSVITHLNGVHYPQTKLKQGEAGQAIKVEGSYHRFAITSVEAPKESIAV